MSEEKNKKNTRRIMKRDFFSILKFSLIILIPFTFLYITLFDYLYQFELNNAIELVIGEESQHTQTVEYIIKDIYDNLLQDLFVIKNSNEMENYLNNPDVKNRYEAEQMFYRMLTNKGNFDQIRMLDIDGNEIIRVNNTKSGIQIVEPENLQNKSEKDYFKIPATLDNNQFFISKMDLNVENHEIEVPYKPIIRVVTPVFNDKKERQGSLVINYLGQDILNVLSENFSDTEYDFISFNLVNNDGYYLYNEDFDKTFSFMFETKPQYNIKDELPEFWEKIKKGDNSYYIQNDKIYTYKEINPSENSKFTKIQEDLWYIINSFDLNSITVFENRVIFNLSLIELSILLISMAFIVLLIAIVHFRNQDKERLALTSKIAENTNDAIIITDSQTNIIFANKTFQQVTGYSLDEVIGKKTSYFKSGLHSKHFYKLMWEKLNKTGFWEGELWDRKKDGLLYPKLLKIYAVEKKYSKKIDKYIGIYHDLSQRKENEKNIDKLKNYNLVTNLPNENLLNKLVKSNVENNDFFGLVCFSIINYNDIFFNKAENQIFENINSFVNKVQSYLNKKDFIAQISKDTFVLGLISFKDRNSLEEFVKDFFQNIKENQNELQHSHYYDIKGGVALFPIDSQDPKGLMRSATIALEAAKFEKTKDYIFSNVKLEESVKNELHLNLLLRKSIQRNELNINYQPQVDISSSSIVGAEALLRWNNMELGNISPYVFIPIAEKTGFIIELGYWLINKVFKDYKKIQHLLPEGFKISINISPIQFNDENLISKLIELSKINDVDLHNFEIEITESVFVSNTNQLNKKLNEIKSLGLSIALDDFGTGFSSLGVLKDLDIDKLKIDRSFIKDYPEKDNGGIAKVIILIANELGLRVITEGAENKVQVDYLYSIGCDLIQGYYYSKPLQLDDLIEYIKKNS
ncbi:MAG: bifunctional diguanylate cyclase/phosphodiesterase [Pleomorphochaeta sp.]